MYGSILKSMDTWYPCVRSRLPLKSIPYRSDRLKERKNRQKYEKPKIEQTLAVRIPLVELRCILRRLGKFPYSIVLVFSLRLVKFVSFPTNYIKWKILLVCMQVFIGKNDRNLIDFPSSYIILTSVDRTNISNFRPVMNDFTFEKHWLVQVN